MTPGGRFVSDAQKNVIGLPVDGGAADKAPGSRPGKCLAPLARFGPFWAL